MTTLSLSNYVISGYLRCTGIPERIGAAIPAGILLENKQCVLTGVGAMASMLDRNIHQSLFCCDQKLPEPKQGGSGGVDTGRLQSLQIHLKV